MLTRLLIKNYVIIDELEIRFCPKLNVITGETGAGKSIIVGALGLILGERADVSALVNRDKKCVIEGFFESGTRAAVTRFLETHELDISEELVIRREIASSGKSRAFINDTPVTLSQLQELSVHLVDLHQQFDTLELVKSDFQREVVDALAGHGGLIPDYETAYRQWQSLRAETNALKEKRALFEKENDYLSFQFAELEEAGFRDNELEDAESELKTLSHAEEIREALSNINYALSESETPVVQQLKTILQQLQPFADFHPALPEITDRLRTLQIELQDIAGDLDRIGNQVQVDPSRASMLSERLSLGYKLQKKHGVQSTRDLIAIKDQLSERLQAVLDIGDTIRMKEQETELQYAAAKALAGKISAGRKKQLFPLENKVNELLTRVGMPNARLKTELSASAELNPHGMDVIEFLFDANVPADKEGKGGQFMPVRKVASGGELSRLMLCIKSLVAQSVDLPTMIFDEIDTGISGEAARQVGIIMKEMSANRQVICITHQPQIAGRADAHYFVYKELRHDTIKTGIRRLETQERITAIAQMLSGEKPTAAALENAREMLQV
ncbi:MAG: DNA repair protein RecN [Chitinophagaceae bacterium]